MQLEDENDDRDDYFVRLLRGVFRCYDHVIGSSSKFMVDEELSV